MIANFLNVYDKILNLHFIKTAKKKLENSSTQIIAITGSNGKTSVKNILLEMLSTEHHVQATPASFNTPLGIAKFINNELKHDTEFLILEYGARHKNDIKKLCKIFGADYGIVTTISPQHLESFHSIENIIKAKQQLSFYLQNKPCIFNIDNIHTMKMFQEKNGTKLSTSIFATANVYATNIEIKNNQTHFVLHLNNKEFNLKTNLLGRHNIQNICLATSLAHHLEVSTENIVKTIQNLQPTKHRLELIKTHINILDDSYNCSPSSAEESLWILSQFTGKKMIATPGIIECGKEKHNINFNLGKSLARFDYVIIIGKENKQPIFEGIKKEIEDKNLQPKIFFETTLENAKPHFEKLQNNDTLLLLNDLPDDYK